MTEFKLRQLHQSRHRSRQRRRNTARVLNQFELAELFEITEPELKAALDKAGWNYHEDARGQLWASVSLEHSTKSEGNCTP